MLQKIIFPQGTKIPNHIALILDGNRRWARAHNVSTFDGHQKGFEATRRLARAARDFGVHTFTVWGFSAENWGRLPKEISYLMKLFKKLILELQQEAKKEKFRFIHLGRKDRLPKDLVDLMAGIEDETRDFKKNILNIALDYGGRNEILRAVEKITQQANHDQLTEEYFASFLDTANQPYPYPDLCIRPSGEQRTSGFLPWQMTYAELYWEPDYLPDLTAAHLKEAIMDFNRRRRKFGKDDRELHFAFNHKFLAKLEANFWRSFSFGGGLKTKNLLADYIKELYGLSKIISLRAARVMLEGLLAVKNNDWERVLLCLTNFYQLIKDELGLPFDPVIVALLEREFFQKLESQKGIDSLNMLEQISQKLYGEIFRMPIFQIAKAARFRVLAMQVRKTAAKNSSSKQWLKFEEYLESFYLALKERVA